MNSKIQNEHLDYLFKTILSLENIEECYNFFEDLCTVAEIKAMAQRLHVAKMLRDRHIYSDIVASTGASTATISRVNRCLHYGSEGYSTVLERLEKQ
ncbi:MAG: YerC/YecD family TrpR-related protein [Ethanoligenens sp.]|uniref:YerC/YecD family TrpR-related protein n=1 Tax=Ethanoligenens sp. TaxID=2099655 RepID=UPI0039E9250C